MGVYKKYRDKDGKKTGPWFVQYPVERDATGKIKYKIERASWSKKKAMEILRKKQDEFYERDRLGIKLTDMSFSELVDWGLSQDVFGRENRTRSLSSQSRMVIPYQSGTCSACSSKHAPKQLWGRIDFTI